MRPHRALLLSLAALAFTAAPLSNATSDRVAVTGVMERYRAAWLSNDERAVMALLTDDSVLVPAEKPPYAGKAAIEGYWFPKSGPATVVTRFTSTYDQIAISGNLAFVRGTQVIEWKTGAETWRTSGNFAAVLSRTPTGWRIAVQIAANGPNVRLK